MVLTDRTSWRTAKHIGTLSGVVVKRAIRAFLIALLWVVAVLVHGDWYFCCKIDKKNIKLPCKPEGNLTYAEKAKRTEMMKTSNVSFFNQTLYVMSVYDFFMELQ